MKALLAFICLTTLLIPACTPGGRRRLSNEGRAGVEQGERLFRHRCSSCHSSSPGVVVVGLSMAGIAERAASRVAGVTAEQRQFGLT